MGHKAEGQTHRKFVFTMKWRVSGTCQVLVKSPFLWRISIDMYGKVLRVLKMCIGGMVLEKEVQKKDCRSSVMTKSCANTWSYKAAKNKITYSAGGCETEIDFVLEKKKYRKYVRAVKVIPWELQHKLVVIDLDKNF